MPLIHWESVDRKIELERFETKGRASGKVLQKDLSRWHNRTIEAKSRIGAGLRRLQQSPA
jgi:hypothetical protein